LTENGLQGELAKLVVLDTDMLLDTDLPTLSVPAPLAPYSVDEAHFRESTWTRVRNALTRLRWHVSDLGRRRASLKRSVVTISTSSFVLDSARPIPPWLFLLGTLHPTHSVRRLKFAHSPNKLVLVFALGSPLSLARFKQALGMVRALESKLQLVVSTLAPNHVVDPDGSLQRNTPQGSLWLERCDLSSFSKIRTVLTTGDVRTVLRALALGLVPVVVTEEHDPYSLEVAVAVKLKGLGEGLLEEGRLSTETELLKAYGARVRLAQEALNSPVESSGLERALDVIEAMAGDDNTLLTALFVPWTPRWYQYWYLDVYLVYGLVMGSVFILVGSLASMTTDIFV
jgi:hypothetical protein